MILRIGSENTIFPTDRAEQVALSLDAENLWTQSRTKPISESTSNFLQSVSTYDDGGSQSRAPGVHRAEEKVSNVETTRIEETLDIRKMGGKRESADSVNDFYSRGKGSDEKVQEKRYTNFRDGEPVSLTIRNDISQKFVQKQQNESGSGASKNHNSYDKKLNQPNIRPSVSNVFSSLNEYINAPSGNLEERENSVSSSEASSSRAESRIKTMVRNEEATSQDSSWASSLPGEAVGEKSFSLDKPSQAPPKYQNILVPVRLDASVVPMNKPEESPATTSKKQFGSISKSEKTVSDCQQAEHVLSIDTEMGIACGTRRKNTSLGAEARLPAPTRTEIKSEPEVHAAVRENEHVYENIKVPVDKREIGGIEPIAISNPENAFKSAERQDSKRLYENVVAEEKPKETDEAAGYERICEARESLILAETKKTIAPGARGVVPGFQGIIKSTVATKEAQPIGFGTTIDDLSEEELNKYLAELEAEERANEGKAMYENVAPPTYEPPHEDALLRRVMKTSRKLPSEDEDAHEAPIFETVTIGVLPALSEEKLQEKAKKFPVIDYSKQQASSSDSDPRYNDFLDKKAQEESSGKVASEGRIIDGKDAEETSNKNVEPREELNSETPECRTRMDSQEFSEAEWSDDFSVNCAPASTAKDLSSGIIESESSIADNAIVESESTERDDGAVANVEKPKTMIPDLKYSDDSVIRENNINSNVNEDSVDSNDDKGVSEVPTGSLDNPQDNGEGSAQDEGSDHEDKVFRPQTLDIVSTVTTPDNATTGNLYSIHQKVPWACKKQIFFFLIFMTRSREQKTEQIFFE